MREVPGWFGVRSAWRVRSGRAARFSRQDRVLVEPDEGIAPGRLPLQHPLPSADTIDGLIRGGHLPLREDPADDEVTGDVETEFIFW